MLEVCSSALPLAKLGSLEATREGPASLSARLGRASEDLEKETRGLNLRGGVATTGAAHDWAAAVSSAGAAAVAAAAGAARASASTSSGAAADGVLENETRGLSRRGQLFAILRVKPAATAKEPPTEEEPAATKTSLEPPTADSAVEPTAAIAAWDLSIACCRAPVHALEPHGDLSLSVGSISGGMKSMGIALDGAPLLPAVYSICRDSICRVSRDCTRSIR